MIDTARIMYLTRVDNKSVLFLSNGQRFDTFIPLKTIMEELDKNMFLSINKGICINRNYLLEIVGNTYTMTDGTRFEGRVRTVGEHHKNEEQLTQDRKALPSALDFLAQAEMMYDHLPIPLLIGEMVIDEQRHGINLVLRYCNPAMEKFENTTKEKVLGASFYELFHTADPRWMIIFGDVILNGGEKEYVLYSDRFKKKLRIHCFRPITNMGGCMIVPLD